MTQLFDDKGNVMPVTVIEAGPCYVTQIPRPEKDGYLATQLGFGEVRKQARLTRGALGHLGQREQQASQSLAIWACAAQR
ncbi:MAG: hypothetical protein IPO29_07085 [Anaerolineae bacterium]|nr:hypothetical protein [Anaerolineae bacterium]